VVGVLTVTLSARLAFNFRSRHFAAAVMTIRRDMVRTLEFARCFILAHRDFLQRMVRLAHSTPRGGGFSFWNSHDNTLSVDFITSNTLTGKENFILLPAKRRIIAMNFRK